MIPLDLHLDVAPLSTPAVWVEETATLVEVDREGYRPVLGAGADLALSRVGSRGHTLLSVGVHAWSGAWDFGGIDHVATSWQGDLDLGFRWSFGEGQPVQPFLEVAPGLRVAVLAQSWWEDRVDVGVGGHGGFGLLLGKGPIRALVSARLDVAFVPDLVTADFRADEEVTWTWSPSSLRLGVNAGVAFR